MKRTSAALLLLCLTCAPSLAGTISFQITEGGQSNVTKTYTLADSQIDRIVAAYQQGANISLGTVATRNQVLQYWLSLFIGQTIQTVYTSEYNAAVQAVSPPSTINPQ
jgi:hypothetical protein